MRFNDLTDPQKLELIGRIKGEEERGNI